MNIDYLNRSRNPKDFMYENWPNKPYLYNLVSALVLYKLSKYKYGCKL